MLNNKLVTELASLNKNNVSPVTVITGIKYNASLIKVFNNVTFAYDPNWEYEAGNPTYPISFFYVKSMTEQMTSDISQKPMLFYDTVADGSDATKGGLMNVVSDNIITKPKEYKLEILVPANDSTFNNNSFSFDSIANVNGFLFNNGNFTGNNVLATTSRIIDTSIRIIETLLKALYGTSISASSIINTFLQQQDYNKASLEYMWASRRIIKLKLWNGWSFKYLAIKSLDLVKKGENGDFYEGSMVCQEMPILTFRNQVQSKVIKGLNKFSSVTGKLIKSGVNVFINAMTATAGEK